MNILNVASKMNSYLISMENVDVKLGNEKVLIGVNFKIKRGDFISIMGPSGVGKTTLLRTLAGLDKISGGYIYKEVINGNEINLKSAFVPQNPTLLPWRNLLKNVLIGSESGNKNIKTRIQEALEKINLVGLSGSERKFPKELSGGMQQRAAIARALAADPELVLMDEPFSALDSHLRENLTNLVADLAKEKNLTIMLNTHSIDEAIKVSSDVFVLSKKQDKSNLEHFIINKNNKIDNKDLEICGAITNAIKNASNKNIQ